MKWDYLTRRTINCIKILEISFVNKIKSVLYSKDANSIIFIKETDPKIIHNGEADHLRRIVNCLCIKGNRTDHEFLN